MRNTDKEFIEILCNTTDDPVIKDTCLKYLESGIMPKAAGTEKRYVRGGITVKVKARVGDVSMETPVFITVEYDRALNLLSATTTGSDWEYIRNQTAYDGEEDNNPVTLNEQPGGTLFTKEGDVSKYGVIKHIDT